VICPNCRQPNSEQAEACFTCGKALYALVQGAILSSRYVVREPLGRGGMGHVYRAYDRVLEEDVAIKVLRADLMSAHEVQRRFRSEIRLARKVTHANVCRIHEYGEDGGLRFLSMEYVRGVDLKTWLRSGRLTAACAYEIAIQAARGLEAVHAHGIVHRDLKPSNIMVDRQGAVRLMDFGIAKEADTSGLTGSGHLLGTPEYMSPEHAAGAAVDCPSDVYALGCVIFELFVGTPPFRGDTPVATLYFHIHRAAPLAARAGASLPAALQPVLEKALAKKPAARFTAGELAAALGESRAASGVPEGDLATAVAEVKVEEVSPLGPTSTLWPAGASADDARHPWGSSRWWRWGFALTSTAAVAVLVTTGLGPRDAAAPPATGATAIPTATVPATASTQGNPGAGAPRGTAAPAPRPPGSPIPPPRRSPEPAPRESLAARAVPTAPPATVAPARVSPADVGTLSLVIVPAAEVTVDGVSVGTVSRRELLLATGPHALRILHPLYKPLQRKVTIQPRVTQRLVLDLSEKAIPKSP
jgi:serine/threonine-protein kinase